MSPDESKACSKCGETKPHSAFSPRQDKTLFVPTSQCKECRKKRQRARVAADPEKYKEINRRSKAKQGKEFKYARARDSHLLKKYGVTKAQYEAMLAEQGGVCAICYQPETVVDSRRGGPRMLAVDHSHATGKARALLCASCNTALGHFRDSPLLLSRATDYLEMHA